MRLLSYLADGHLLPGLEEGGRVIAAASVFKVGGGPASAKGVLEAAAGDIGGLVQRARSALADDALLVGDLSRLRLGPPISDPDKILCVGQNYADHVAEMGHQRPPAPNIFAKFRNCLVGHGARVLLPPSSSQVDYEGELAVVMGRSCRRVAPAMALEHVAGYAVLNDVSARDLQFQTSQYTVGKAVDTFCPMGPGVLLAPEDFDPQRLGLATYLNGERVQSGNTAEMLFSVAEVVSFLSQVITLEPGDIIATGTPSGVGYRRDPPRFLRPGDVIEVEIEEVGRISNPVGQG